MDRRDGFFEPIPPSSTIYLLAIVLGLYENPTRPGRVLKEALRHTRLAGLVPARSYEWIESRVRGRVALTAEQNVPDRRGPEKR